MMVLSSSAFKDAEEIPKKVFGRVHQSGGG
jgi:hypothetical protein